MTKMTYVKAIECAINGEMTDEVVEKLNALKAQLVKRSTEERKPTKAQIENAGFKTAIITHLTVADKAMTIKEMQAEIAEIASLTNQRVTHLLTDLVNAETLSKVYIKKVPYYSIKA